MHNFAHRVMLTLFGIGYIGSHVMDIYLQGQRLRVVTINRLSGSGPTGQGAFAKKGRIQEQTIWDTSVGDTSSF
jgi:hypothetical protein